MKEFCKLIRVKHYTKNLLIFLALMCSGNLFIFDNFIITFISFISFCLIASAIYTFNDIVDVDKDKLHPIKKNRPIASGKISISSAKFFCILLILGGIIIQTILFKIGFLNIIQYKLSVMLLILYLFLNIIYSLFAKNIPIIDIIILSLGFLIRVYYGGVVCDIKISYWLYMTILSFSLFLIIGKRIGELKMVGCSSREVLKSYDLKFLEKALYSFMTLTLVFYSLWCILSSNTVFNNDLLIYSIIILIIIVLQYSLIIEKNSFGDPVDVLFSNKYLLISILVYVFYMMVVLLYD